MKSVNRINSRQRVVKSSLSLDTSQAYIQLMIQKVRKLLEVTSEVEEAASEAVVEETSGAGLEVVSVETLGAASEEAEVISEEASEEAEATLEVDPEVVSGAEVAREEDLSHSTLIALLDT